MSKKEEEVLPHEDSFSDMLKKAILFGIEDEGVNIDTLDDDAQEGIAAVVNFVTPKEK